MGKQQGGHVRELLSVRQLSPLIKPTLSETTPSAVRSWGAGVTAGQAQVPFSEALTEGAAVICLVRPRLLQTA